MLKLSCNLSLLVIFLTLVSFASFWPLNLIQFGKRPNPSGFVLGASRQRNLVVDVKHYPQSDKVTASVLAFAGQKTVYHNISTVNNNSTRPRVFSIANLRLSDGSLLVDNFGAYFMVGSKILKEVSLNPNEQATFSVEITGKETGPATFRVSLSFDVQSF